VSTPPPSDDQRLAAAEARSERLAVERARGHADNARLRTALEHVASPSGLQYAQALQVKQRIAREALASTPVQASAPPRDADGCVNDGSLRVYVKSGAGSRLKTEAELMAGLGLSAYRKPPHGYDVSLASPEGPADGRHHALVCVDGMDAIFCTCSTRDEAIDVCEQHRRIVQSEHGYAPQASAPGRVPEDAAEMLVDAVEEAVRGSATYAEAIEVARALLGAPSPERDIRGAVRCVDKLCPFNFVRHPDLAVCGEESHAAQPVTPSEPVPPNNEVLPDGKSIPSDADRGSDDGG